MLSLSEWAAGRTWDVILADPPWSYYGSPTKDQAAGKHYALMQPDEVWSLPVGELAHERSVLLLWATCPQLHVAVKTVTRWGFFFRGVAYVWVKTSQDGRVISGQGVRPTLVKPTTELVLFGTRQQRGRPLPLCTESQGQVVLAPRPGNVHSRKPPEVHRRIEELFGQVRRVELFAREQAQGWDAWGLEVGS